MLGMGASDERRSSSTLSCLNCAYGAHSQSKHHITQVWRPSLLLTSVAAMCLNKTLYFVELLRKQGLDYQPNPISQALNHQGVVSLMHDDISHHYDNDIRGYQAAIARGCNWLLIKNQEHDKVDYILHAHQILVEDSTTSLIEAAGRPPNTFGLCSSKATLKEAWDLCKEYSLHTTAHY